jgi:hypothetical protein
MVKTSEEVGVNQLQHWARESVDLHDAGWLHERHLLVL